MFTKDQILAAAVVIPTDRVVTLRQRMLHKIEFELNSCLGAIKTKCKFIKHIEARCALEDFFPNPHESATLICLDDVISRRCQELDVSEQEVTLLFEELQRRAKQ